jgi:Ca2+/Na+ antiporter
VIGGVASFAFGFINTQFSVFFRVVYGLYYLYIWIVGLRINVDYEYPTVYMRKFFYNSFAMVVLMLTVGLTNIFFYMNELSMYFVIYAVSVMLYIGKINIEAIYSDRDANEISGKKDNKYKGIVINMLVIFLIIFLIATALVDNSGFLRDVFEMALRPVGLFGERVSHFIENRLVEHPLKINEGNAAGSADPSADMMEEYRQQRNHVNINYKLIVQILFAVGALIGLTIYARKLFKRGRLVEKEEVDYCEIRENVFSKKLLYDNTLGKMFGVMANLFSKKARPEPLESIRQKYRDTIMEMMGSGQEIVVSDTPDEILKKVVLTPEERERFTKLTEAYKQYRYSQTLPDQYEIDRIVKLEVFAKSRDN